MKLDEEAEGTTDDFDLIEMDNQIMNTKSS